MLVLARSIKNAFAPINRIPPEVLSLLPDYCSTGKLVALTHVCRSWREVFISRTSLWTFLDCTNLDRTRTYLERSKTSPLEIRLEKRRLDISYDAFQLIIPHIGRLKALTLSAPPRSIIQHTKHLVSPASLLEKLEIRVRGTEAAVVEDTLFDGILQSLRELRLSGVVTDLPWQNLPNLTTFHFRQISNNNNNISVTRLLDLFEGAPLLCEIKLVDSLPDSSNAPAERLVSLPRLRLLRICDSSVLSVLLNHLRIPVGALVALEFAYCDDSPQFLDWLPRSLDNLGNISQIPSIHLTYTSGVTLWFEAPSGGLSMVGTWYGEGSPPLIAEHQVLWSLNRFPISTTESLTIAQCDVPVCPKTEESAAYQTLLLMNNIRTLTLVDCLNLPFIFALDPNKNTSNTVVCPKLEKLVLYTQEQTDETCTEELLEMAMERASRGAKLPTLVIDCSQELLPEDKVSELKSHVSHVERQLGDEPPGWDTIPGDIGHFGWWD